MSIQQRHRVELTSPNMYLRDTPLIMRLTSRSNPASQFQLPRLVANRRLPSSVNNNNGVRVPRTQALAAHELRVGAEPPDMADFDPLYACSICLSLKSHPVSYTCGHGHCYLCIRLWLERDWGCPDCRAPIRIAPFRIFSEERAIESLYGNGTRPL
ncbi:hypothetical protein C8J57DRAFT_1538046 [Mycena rebaudengoi]|nr:hypothetical protein C8J57DRAFT_1538046 [Mycena rebaudengoi]